MTATQASGNDNQIRIGDREARLRDVLGHAGRLQLGLTERSLFAIGAGMCVAGFIAIVVAWIGTSRTVLVAGQIPYVVSGGLIGLGLVFLGGFLYFGHWLAMMVKENRQRADSDREDSAQLREALDDLNRTLSLALSGGSFDGGVTNGAGAIATSRPSRTLSAPARSSGGGPGTFLATPSGTMMHRPTCAAVAGRERVRRVSQADGLKACGLCRPLDPAES